MSHLFPYFYHPPPHPPASKLPLCTEVALLYPLNSPLPPPLELISLVKNFSICFANRGKCSSALSKIVKLWKPVKKSENCCAFRLIWPEVFVFHTCYSLEQNNGGFWSLNSALSIDKILVELCTDQSALFHREKPGVVFHPGLLYTIFGKWVT